ncbi:MAG: hypothetical protein VCB25_02105, partial [Myxococcota bacterium]
MKRVGMIGLIACLLGAHPAQGKSEASAWQETLDRVALAVVVLRVTTPRAFDDQVRGTSIATGFVVDEELGL